MITNNAPRSPGSRGVDYLVGFVFFILGLSMFGKGNTAGGFTFLIIGVVFLLSGQPGLNGKKAGHDTSGFPTEGQSRREQADTERKLRDKALGPDTRGGTPAAMPQRPSYPMNPAPSRQGGTTKPSRGFEVHMTADEIGRRREELKGLLDSGIITKEEYYDRLRRMH